MHQLVIIFAMFQASWVFANFACYALSRNWPFASLRWLSFIFEWISCRIKYVFIFDYARCGRRIFFRWFFVFLNFVTTYTWIFRKALTWETSKNITPPHSVAVTRCKCFFFRDLYLFEIENPFHIRILQRICGMLFFSLKYMTLMNLQTAQQSNNGKSYSD